jgi:hypothetical protein
MLVRAPSMTLPQRLSRALGSVWVRRVVQLAVLTMVVLASVGLASPGRGLASLAATAEVVAHHGRVTAGARAPGRECREVAPRRFDVKALEVELDDDGDGDAAPVAEQPPAALTRCDGPASAARPPRVEPAIDPSRVVSSAGGARAPPV